MRCGTLLHGTLPNTVTIADFAHTQFDETKVFRSQTDAFSIKTMAAAQQAKADVEDKGARLRPHTVGPQGYYEDYDREATVASFYSADDPLRESQALSSPFTTIVERLRLSAPP